MPLKGTEYGLEFAFIGSQKKSLIAYNFTHLSDPGRMHFVELGKKYIGMPLLFVVEKKDGVWIGEDGRAYPKESAEHEAFETISRARLKLQAKKILSAEELSGIKF